MYIWLHNIRSAHNVGTILRTVDALGDSQVVLSGYTPKLEDKYGLPNNKLLKVSLGAEESVPVFEFDIIENFIDFLITQSTSENQLLGLDNLESKMQFCKSKLGYQFVSMELNDQSINYFDYTPQNLEKLILIMGNEVTGVEQSLLDLSDQVLQIPMSGVKESLNVAVSLAIVSFYLRDNTK